MDFEIAVNCTLAGVNSDVWPWVVEVHFEMGCKENFHPLGQRVEVCSDPSQPFFQRLGAVNDFVPPVQFVAGSLLNSEDVYKALAVD